jgi:predicted ester cyclase
MSLESNKAVLRRIVDEIYNQGKLAAIDELFAASYVERDPPVPGFPEGRAGVHQYFASLRSAFPDLRVVLEDVIAEGDKAVARLTATGTFKQSFMGMAPTGKRATWAEVHICRLSSNNQLVEHWGSVDQLGMLQQLGVIPELAPA